MRKLIAIALLFGSSWTAKAQGTGGYFGHRLILNVEGAYSPFYSSIGDLFTHADLQYGVELGAIVGRRVQVELFYNMYSLSGNDLYYGSSFGSKDRVEGTQVGFSYRRFLGKTGGIAPIGRFVDFTLGYSMNDLAEGADNPYVMNNDLLNLPGPVDVVTPSIAFGRQALFCNRIVITSGFRFGKDFQVSGKTADPVAKRLNYKDYFSTFLGVGILL